MSDETGLYQWIVTGILGLGGAVMGWLLNRTISQQDRTLEDHAEQLKEHTKQHAECSLDLANFKTEVARDYAKEVTMQQSLGRIHDRIDVISGDIKQILQKVK